MDQRRLTLSDIVIGEPLPCDIYDADRKLLLRKGHVVASAQQVTGLLDRGLYVDARQATGTRAHEPPARQVEQPSVVRLLTLANKHLERTLYGLGDDAESKILDIARVLKRAAALNNDIALGCILLNQNSGQYTVRHGIDTALLAATVMRVMGKPDAEVMDVMAAALTMNLGMLRIHEQLQNKQEALTEKETDLIRTHPNESVAILRQAGIRNPSWLSYVQLHHENEDGSGYPQGKDAPALPQNAKILAFADRYCAAVVNRKYRKTLLPGAALRDVLMPGGQPTDPLLAAYFIKTLGPYPVGTFVRLQNDEIAVVTAKPGDSPSPTVHALFGPRGVPLSIPLKRETSKPSLAIREAIPAAQVNLRFSLQQLWGDEASL